MKRKLFAMLLTFALALGVTAPVCADVIWAPEDKFYEAHQDECDYEGRKYQLAGYGGTVTVRSAPVGWEPPFLGKAPVTLDNGLEGTIQFIWSGGDEAWGYLCNVEDIKAEGWVPMDDLSRIYDSQQFREDHADEITTGGPAETEFTEAWLYEYPGGPKRSVLEEDKDYMPFDQVFQDLYIDENGLCWGYVGYYMGHRNAWVCLDDPMNEALDTAVVEPQPSAAQERGAPTVEESSPGMTLVNQADGDGGALAVAALLVAAVVVLTLVLIRKLRPKIKDKE